MNEQDKQACKDAKWQHLVDLKPLTFDTGWQAALEYARGQQEPVGIFGGEFGGDVNGRMWFKVKCNGAIPSPGCNIYTHPAQPVQPAATPEEFNAQSFASLWSSYCDKKIEVEDLKEVNQQMLKALQAADIALRELAPCMQPECNQPQKESHEWAFNKVCDAIAAAEAAKGGV